MSDINKILDSDVRSYCIQLDNEVKRMYPLKRKGKITIQAWPAAAAACCFNSGGIYHENSKGYTNVKFDQRIENEFQKLGGTKGSIVEGCKNRLGKCAEQRAANLLLATTYNNTRTYSIKRIIFSKAYRPRTMTTIPMCNNCISIFKEL